MKDKKTVNDKRRKRYENINRNNPVAWSRIGRIRSAGRAFYSPWRRLSWWLPLCAALSLLSQNVRRRRLWIRVPIWLWLVRPLGLWSVVRAVWALSSLLLRLRRYAAAAGGTDPGYQRRLWPADQGRKT